MSIRSGLSYTVDRNRSDDVTARSSGSRPRTRNRRYKHAHEEDTGDLNEPLNDLTQALDRLEDAEGGGPKPDRLDSIHDELVGLEEDEEGEIQEHLRRARDHVRAYRENADELPRSEA
ncbi:DUF7553 family protein [Halalkalicoccus salilacus]